ncbi:hypothetical protein AA313_de0210251 [Arthrobotrys entomopaga]|nr:hypothetical protein AA313_de0210251 [Arthrobotrys entomopaga]
MVGLSALALVLAAQLAYSDFIPMEPQITRLPGIAEPTLNLPFDINWKRDVAGYTKVAFTTAKAVPSFDKCINWKSIGATNSDQTCADICTNTSGCKSFAIASTKSATYCGWWGATFTTSDATVKNWDGQGAITGTVSAYNKGASSTAPMTSKPTAAAQRATTTLKTSTTSKAAAAGKTSTAASTNCGVKMWFENINRSPTDIYFDVPSLQACANHCYDDHHWKWGNCKSYSWYPQQSYCEVYVQDFTWNMQWATRDAHSPIYMYDATCDVNSTAAIIAESPTKANTALTAAQRQTSCGVYGWPKTELQQVVRDNPSMSGNWTKSDCINYCATSHGDCLSVEWKPGSEAGGNCYAYAGPWETRIDTCNPATDAKCQWQFYEATCV